jgi:amino acid transporter
MPRDRPSPFTLAPGRIPAAGIAFLALAAVAPITVLATVVPQELTHRIAVVPLVFAAAGLVLLLFSVGYVAMARRALHAGPLSAFVARGIGRPFGVGAGWVAVASYQGVQFSLYAVAGAAAAPLLATFPGVRAPWWMVAAGCWFVVAITGLLRIEVAGGILAVLVLAEIAVLAGFELADLLDPAGHRITWGSLDPAAVIRADRPALGLLLVVAVLAFVGFETTAAYGEEARGARRALPRSTYAVVTLLGLLYAVGAFATGIAVGPSVATVATARGPELIFDLAAARLAPWAVTLGRVLLFTGILAALVGLHHTLARYLFALGRERLLPPFLGRTSARASTPRAASLTQSVVAGAAIAAGWWRHLDPTGALAVRLAAAGALGIVVLMTASSLAALLHLNRVPGRENPWQRFVAPALSTVALGAVCYLAYRNLPTLLDVPPGDPYRVYAVPALIGALFLLGMGYAAIVRAVKPVVYAAIGLGGSAVVVAPAVPRPRVPGAHRRERIRR